MTPTAKEVFEFIQENRFSSSAGHLARLMMSMHNGRTSVSFWDDLQRFDDIRTKQVATLMTEFVTGVYKDGDFNPVAEWLIEDCGYLDDVHKEERAAWKNEHRERLSRDYKALPASKRDQDSGDFISLEEFGNQEWRAKEFN